MDGMDDMDGPACLTMQCPAADIPRIHDIRHSFASQLLANGAPLLYVKEQMGHASIQTTVDIYGRLIQGANRNKVTRLDDAVFGGAEFMQKAG